VGAARGRGRADAAAAGCTGAVTDLKSWNGRPGRGVCVTWDAHQGRNVYRHDFEDVFDLALAAVRPRRAPAPSGRSSRALHAAEDPAWRRGLARGHELDAMDLFRRWYPARVRQLAPGGGGRLAVRVAFAGWGPRFDEWIPLDSPRLAPRGARVEAFPGATTDDVELRDEDLPSRRGTSGRVRGGGCRPRTPSPAVRPSQVVALPLQARARTAGGLAVQAQTSVQLRRQGDVWADAVVLVLGARLDDAGEDLAGAAAEQEEEQASDEPVEEQAMEEEKVDEGALVPDCVLVRARRATAGR
jgi:hypothetical protein